MEKPLHPSVPLASLGKKLAEIAGKHHLSIIYAFGSRAKEVEALLRQGSCEPSAAGRDLDIAVLPEARTKLRVRDKAELALELEDLFGVSRVDLLVLSESDPFLAANAIRGERIFCKDTHAGDEYELYVLRRAGDLAPFERQRIRLILEGEK